MPRENKLCVSFDAYPCISISNFRIGDSLKKFVAILTTNESPNLIGFDIFDRDVLNLARHELFAMLASIQKYAGDRFLFDSGDPLNASDAVTLKQESQNHQRLFFAEVHIA